MNEIIKNTKSNKGIYIILELRNANKNFQNERNNTAYDQRIDSPTLPLKHKIR